ncbi:STF2-like protein [Metarhizium brunneum]
MPTCDSRPLKSRQGTNKFAAVTRTVKANDRDHKGLAEGTAVILDQMPRYTGKAGFTDTDPKKVKKNGCGRGNWGTFTDDVMGQDFSFNNARRRSNSSSASHHLNDFKTKFEVIDSEPVFEESVHGPVSEEDDVSKTDSSESGRSAS